MEKCKAIISTISNEEKTGRNEETLDDNAQRPGESWADFCDRRYAVEKKSVSDAGFDYIKTADLENREDIKQLGGGFYLRGNTVCNSDDEVISQQFFMINSFDLGGRQVIIGEKAGKCLVFLPNNNEEDVIEGPVVGHKFMYDREYGILFGAKNHRFVVDIETGEQISPDFISLEKKDGVLYGIDVNHNKVKISAAPRKLEEPVIDVVGGVREDITDLNHEKG